MNRLKIMEIRQRRHEESRRKVLINAALRSPIGRPITYILDKQNRLTHHANSRHYRNAESRFQVNREERVSLTLLPTGCKASKIVCKHGSPSNEALEFPHSDLPMLPQRPSGPLLPHRKRPCTGEEVPTQPLTDAEKRDRLFIRAVEVISEWTAEEPNFINPEAAYGDKNFRFIDSVKVRLRVFKATISPNMMEILESASRSCKRTPRNDTETDSNNKATDKTHVPFQHNTPDSCAQSKTQSAIMPRKSPFLRTLSSSTHRSTNSRPGIQLGPGDNNDYLSRISPAAKGDRRKSMINPIPQSRQSYQYEMQIMERPIPARCFEEVPSCSRGIYLHSNGQNIYINRNYWEPSPRYRCNMRNYDVDLDSPSSSRWPPHRRLDVGEPKPIPYRINKPERLEEENEDDISLTASLLHPIWDTPEECKTRWSNFMLLD